MKPGACGYFNDNGNRHKIVQLTDADEVKKKLGKEVTLLDPSGQLEVEEDITTTWTAKVSTNVHGSMFNLDSSLIPPGSPVSANVGWEYTCDSSDGTVILAHDKIVTTGLYGVNMNGVDKTRSWMDDHIEDIANATDDPRSASKKGLFLRTRTYAILR
ncbi:hypothetical protein BCR34DRAFT_576870 [Clohesyomyces aquaticus]|uniref:Uncharacterized protein n=1 Tax=Clohesyomyces aquaticus TaxID=1231657 RepID=A0A1Y1YLK4_9PLEO|nr:hypothetical protein BCR34DRAFT_576870 [Clohesyomyces aquaticus]